MSVSLPDDYMDFTKLKVAELKAELKKRGLSTDGKKNDLIERLQTSIGDAALLDDAHDDLLDDEELSDEGLDDTAIEATLATLDEKTVKRPGGNSDENPPPKKIVLNRKVVEATEPPAPEISSPEPVIVTTVTGPKIAEKVGDLSMNERLAKRKARFSGSAVTAPNVISILKDAAPSQPAAVKPAIDVLKKRAERFGTVAPVLEKAQLEEKKLLRMKRFGDDKSETNGSLADKKAQRAARFQITL